ncbi:MAG: hypothetical protein AAGA77_00340 [Bacteroidota bacterium]
MIQPKTIFQFLFLFLITSITAIGQGEVLNRNESAGSFLFSTSSIEQITIRSLGYTYSHRRTFELGVAASRLSGRSSSSNATGVSASAALILNSSNWIHAKIFYTHAFSNRFSSAFGGTLFLNNSSKTSKIVPNFTLLNSDGELGFAPGLDFRFGTTANLIGGISMIKYDNTDWIVGIALGFMFSGS